MEERREERKEKERKEKGDKEWWRERQKHRLERGDR